VFYTIASQFTITYMTVVEGGPPPVIAFSPSPALRSPKTVAILDNASTRSFNSSSTKVPYVIGNVELSNVKPPSFFASPAPYAPKQTQFYTATHSSGTGIKSPMQKLEWYQDCFFYFLQGLWRRFRVGAPPYLHKAVLTITSTNNHVTLSILSQCKWFHTADMII
jgi:hypothetical protein